MAINLNLQNNEEIRSQLLSAMQGDDEEELVRSFTAFADGIQQTVLQRAQTMIQDRNVLAERGVALLTSEERAYYEELIEKRTIAGVDKLFPKTVFNRVYEDLVENHALLTKINFANVTGLTEWIVRTSDVVPAFWGKLTDEITKQLESGFDTVQANLFKLSAYIPMSNAMLDLGPEWLDNYIRTILQESMALAIEIAIVKGTGKDQPIGMMKDLDGSVVAGVYPDKTAVALPELSVVNLGAMVSEFTRGGKRTVNKLLWVVNSHDYWTKIFPAMTTKRLDGTYAQTLPIPADIVQSSAVPAGKLVVGIASDYFFGVGSTQKIESSKEYRFLEDQTIFVTKQYANGKPVANDSFKVYDISGVTTAAELVTLAEELVEEPKKKATK